MSQPKMKFAIDIMGGDNAPLATVKGAILALKELPTDYELVLIGNQSQIQEIIDNEKPSQTNYSIVHADQFIEMGEHPTKALREKPNSSIAIGFSLVKEGKVHGFASAGNTGAMLVGSKLSLPMIPGVLRPCVISNLPKIKGQPGILLDVGTNVDCKPEMLEQFAIIGSVLSKSLYQIEKPKVGLMNVGEEEGKGNALSLATYSLLKENKKINFIGNVEGRDLFNDRADVIVCDGFTGNIIIKTAESIFYMMKKRGISDEYFDKFNYENHGGSPIVGIDANIVIGHGISNDVAIKNMILLMKEVAVANLASKIKEQISL